MMRSGKEAQSTGVRYQDHFGRIVSTKHLFEGTV